MGFKRSEKRMAAIEVKLRAGMARNGITGEVQDTIVHSITSFALYGFPESHAASFALLAYASAYLKCHYLAAFTCAMLNNQPMGFYSPAILIKDAQRHGLRVLPVDIVQSDWNCTVGHASDGPTPYLRLGLRYARGLREDSGKAILRARAERPFSSVDDLAVRVRELRKDELNRLAGDRCAQFAGRGASPRCSLADATRHSSGRSAACRRGGGGTAIAARAYEYLRATLRRLSWHRPDRRQTSHGVSPR
ncbi:MAG: hypothetical protein WDO73_04830 [Ignavibacteriota bacterium]